MTRLHRPYIPWSVRETVVLRQIDEQRIDCPFIRYDGSTERRVRAYLYLLFGDAHVELHHRPALLNRKWVRHWIKGKGEIVIYDPPANDPNHLVYLRVGDHDVETRVRGQRGQHSDLGLARKRKRKERRETARLLRSGPWGNLKRPKGRLRSRGFPKRPPQRSASRPIVR